MRVESGEVQKYIMLDSIVRRYPWLSIHHPIGVRESRHFHYRFPGFIRKLTDPWSMIGYAALIHGFLFMLAVVGFQHILPSASPLFLPFLTPLGTPIAVAFLHSILYWAMLIGICNYSILLIGRDFETRTWDYLRVTPLASGELLKAKFATVFRTWSPILRMLVLTRLFTLVTIPLAIAYRQDNVPVSLGFNLVGAFVFIAQPLADAFMVATLSAMSAAMIRNMAWAKVGAYGIIAAVYGAINGLGSLWLIFKSPLGALAGVLVPLGHWAPLASTLAPSATTSDFALRMGATVLFYLLMPLLIGILAFRATNRMALR